MTHLSTVTMTHPKAAKPITVPRHEVENMQRKGWQVATPLIDFEAAVGGTGDLFTALFLARHLAGRPLPDCLSLAVSALYAVLQETRRQGRREMALVTAQEALVQPPEVFPPVLIA